MISVKHAGAAHLIVIIEWAKSDTGFVQAEHVTVAVFDLVSWFPVETIKMTS